MICHCALVLLGWAFLLYLLYHLATSLYNLIYPFFIATPINLHKAAGGKWAGKGYLLSLIFFLTTIKWNLDPSEKIPLLQKN